MAADVYNIAPKQTYTFAITAGGNPITIALGPRAIPTAKAVSATLMVTVSAGSSMPTGASVKVAIGNTLIRDDEPNTLFAPLAAVSSLGLVTINAADSTGWPALYTNGWSGGTGLMVSCAMIVTPGGSSGNVVLVAAVDLVIRDA